MSQDNNNDEILLGREPDVASAAEGGQASVAGNCGEEVSDAGQKPLSSMDVFRKVFLQK